jgi:hypothetical protein
MHNPDSDYIGTVETYRESNVAGQYRQKETSARTERRCSPICQN